jgi:hypothetical protein
MSHRDGRVTLHAWVDPATRDSAREAARQAGLDFSRWVERAVMRATAAESAERALGQLATRAAPREEYLARCERIEDDDDRKAAR